MSGAVSRPSLHKSTRRESARRRPFSGSSLSQPLTSRADVDLRSDCFTEQGLMSWREAVWEWRHAVEDNRDTWAVMRDSEGEEFDVEIQDRFTSSEWEKRYAKLNGLENGLREAYGRRLHTVMLTITASSTDDDGNPRPPIDHLLDIEASNDARTSALARVLDGKRYERVALPEEHESGYIHWHYAIFVDGEVEAEDFKPVISAHLNNCESAGAEAHEIRPDDPSGSSVVVRHVGDGETGEISNLAAYLTSYTLGKGSEYNHDPLEAPESRQMMLALLWATNKRYWRPTDGAQSFMSRSNTDSEESYEMVGIKDGKDGEIHEVVPGQGGVTMLSTWGAPPD